MIEEEKKGVQYFCLPRTHFLVAFRQIQSFLSDPFADSVWIDIPFLADLCRCMVLVHHLVADLHLLLLGEILSSLSLVL